MIPEVKYNTLEYKQKLHNDQTEGHTIESGDFNLVLNTHIDKSGAL